MSDKLKNCPHCGNSDYLMVIRVEGETVLPDNFQVVCSWLSGGCGASGGVRRTQAEAIAAWNKRADEPAECDNIGGKCSKCGKDLPEPGYTGYEYEGNYCPTCGAKVRKPEQPVDKARDTINALRAYYGAGKTSMTDEQIQAGMEHYRPKREYGFAVVDELSEQRPVDNAQADSQEKLVAEVTATVSNLVKYGDAHPALFEKAKSWLDRQAAITERELCAKCEWPSLAAMPDLEQQERIAEQDRRIVEYAEQVDKLTAKRDEWKTKCDIREVAYKQADAERKRYSEQIDELIAERDELRDKLTEKQRVCDVQRDSFLKMERDLADANERIGELERTIENMRGD